MKQATEKAGKKISITLRGPMFVVLMSLRKTRLKCVLESEELTEQVRAEQKKRLYSSTRSYSERNRELNKFMAFDCLHHSVGIELSNQTASPPAQQRTRNEGGLLPIKLILIPLGMKLIP